VPTSRGIAITGAWWLTSYDALLLVVATQILQMVRQLTPLVRFDGYHVLADVTGVPDLFHRIKPTLLGALPWRWGDPEARLLKPWARVVVTLWVLVVVPVLLFTVGMLVLALPRVLATAWAKLTAEQGLLSAAWGDGDLVQVAARCLVMAAVGLPVLGIAVMLFRTGRMGALAVWRGTDGRPARRAVAGVLAASMIGGLAYAWWPDDERYRPIQPYERGTLVDGMAAMPVVNRVAPDPGLTVGATGTTQALWDTSQPLPTKASPQLAVVMIPTDASSRDSDEGWVFPFDKPLAPGEGDNQALAVNTTDGTVEYDTAFALVWVEDGAAALNTNEAYAFASCASCAAVAVAFQVVFVAEDNHVAAPQNLAGALSSDCVGCLTYALAKQLFITLDGPLSDGAMAQLDELWAKIAKYGKRIAKGKVPLAKIQARLDRFEKKIFAIVAADQPAPSASPASSTSVSGSASPSASESASSSTLESASPSSGAAALASPSAGTSSSPEAGTSPTADAGSTSPSPSASSDTSISASPTAEPSPSATASPAG
jgi:putative peptide zinc metalloprotease protein